MGRGRTIDLDDWIERDLSAAAVAGELAPAFEVDELLRRVEEVLVAGERRSPVLVGERGVGKTAVLEQVVRALARGDGPEVLRGARVVEIGLAAIAGRFPNPGKANDFAQRFFDHLVDAPSPVVPLVRDLHAAYTLNWEPILHRFLSRSRLPILAEAHPRGFDELVDYWSDLNAFLAPIPVEEPPPERLRRIVAQWNDWTAGRGERPFGEDAQSVAVELTARFMGHRRFPRKALELLQQTRLVADRGAGAPSGAEGAPIGVEAVVRRFSELTRVPRRLVDPGVSLDLDDVQDFLAERLLGQEEAVDAIVRMIALIKAGLTDVRRPFGVLLFVGPTGVGKTHAAQLLAEYLFGDRQRLIRINMADYADEQHVPILFGHPHADTLAARRGVLASRLVGHPFGVLLLDELEKAHRKVHDAFLQLVDEGRFINGMGETVSATSLIVIATSNAGVEVYRETGLGFRQERDVEALDAELDRRLLQTFRFEFLNRFDHVVHFHPLDRSHIRLIARRELAELLRREGVRRRRLDVEVGPEVLDWLVAHGYHPHFGARFLRREIERSVTAALADFIVRHRPPPGARLALGVRRNRPAVRLLDTPETRERVTVSLPGDGITPAPAPVRVELTGRDLWAEARRWLERWEALERDAEARREEASRLIEASQAPGFWDAPERAQQVLKQYKDLDARVQAESRLLAPYRRLRGLLDAEREPPVELLGELVEAMAHGYRRWLDLGAYDGPTGAWLLIGPGEPLSPPDAWLGEVVGMYRAWFRRRPLTAEVVAERPQGTEVTHVVFEVEGARVLSELEPEQGIHRRRFSDGRTSRVQVDVIPRRDDPVEGPLSGLTISRARRTRGVHVERRAARVRVEIPERGLDLTFVGAGEETLRLLGRDLLEFFRTPQPAPETARTYGLAGGGVRDPRTSATHRNIKDVLRGHLDPFLRAWEAR